MFPIFQTKPLINFPQQSERNENIFKRPVNQNKAEQLQQGKTLIVVKASLFEQWKQEISNHAAENTVVFNEPEILNTKKKKVNNLHNYDIVLTTYETLRFDYTSYKLKISQQDNQDDEENEKLQEQEQKKKKQQQIQQQQQQNDNQQNFFSDFFFQSIFNDDKEQPEYEQLKQLNNFQAKKGKKVKAVKKKRKPGPTHLFQINWFRIVLDEAQEIGNKKTVVYESALNLQGTNRWLLSGTPFQNKLDELYTALAFLKYSPWDNWQEFQDHILYPIKFSNPKAENMLFHILQPVMLRRTNKSKYRNGEDILALPPKEQHDIYINMNKDERDLYDSILDKKNMAINNASVKGKVPYMMHLEALIRLRMICDHIYLFKCKNKFSENTTVERIQKSLQELQQSAQREGKKNYNNNYIENLKIEITNGQQDICSICFELIDTMAITKCDQPHIFCSDCVNQLITTAQRQALHTFKCPQCRHELKFQNDVIQIEKDESFQVYEESKNIPSSKQLKVLEILRKIIANNEKVVIFIQFVQMIQLIKQSIQNEYGEGRALELQGSMNPTKRQKTLHSFSNDQNANVLLCSLKVGGTGLNLVCANNVIIFDPWWNPAVEQQAMGRIHRIGQTKKVTIYRMIMRNTVESRMVETLQPRKQKLIDNILQGKEIDKKMTLDEKEIRELLNK